MIAPLKFFTSLRLTVLLLVASMILIFIATLDQVHLGIYEVQRRYFRAWIAWVDFGAPGGWRFPLPGGWLLGTLLLANLLAAHVMRFKWQARKLGMILIHSGVALLLVGELLTGIMTVESQMRLDEGQTSNFVTRPREVELVVIESNAEGKERVVAIPQSRLVKGAVFAEGSLPFSLRIVEYFQNATFPPREGSPTPATRGIGRQTMAIEQPRETAPNRRDAPAVYVELVVPDAKENAGIYLLSNAIALTQEATVGDRTFQLFLRERRDYLPYTITLKDFKHDRYEGTEIPKNFSSQVRLKNPESGEDREVVIYMNNPLRYDGLTFYQASFDNADTTSILQVVKNPVWILPYVSCALVTLGLVVAFLLNLGRFLSRRNQ